MYLFIFQSIFHLCWLYFLMRLLEVKSTGGSSRDVCPCNGPDNSVSDDVHEANEDVPDDEDEDVAQERSKVTSMDLRNEAWPPVRIH